MAENRRRFRNKKRDDGRLGPTTTAPLTIARREETRAPAVQPKILLKKEIDPIVGSGSSGSNNDVPSAIKTIIIHRSEVRNSSERVPGPTNASSSNVCAALASSTLPVTATLISKDKNGTPAAAGAGQDSQQPLRMTRPTPLLVSNGELNDNARKLLNKSNTDFTVIGVLGAQCVGKSTLLNLLSAEHPSDYDYYQHLIAADGNECIFANRHKSKSQQAQNKNVLRPRTKLLQFFITRERYILLDTSPMLAGGTAKEADHLELQTLSLIMQLLSVCHVLLVAMEEINLEQLRLLHAALRLRPRIPFKGYVNDYLPQVIFVRTRGQRQHFEPAYRERLDKQLAQLFEGTALPIYRGRGESRTINSFLLPEFSSNAATVHHASMPELVRQFRERVFSSVRESMCQSNDFSEAVWFELLTETARKCNSSSQHFEQIYAEIKLRHLELRSKWHPECNWRKES